MINFIFIILKIKMKLSEICKQYSIDTRVVKDNQQLLKLISYWVDSKIKDVTFKFSKEIKRLTKENKMLQEKMKKVPKENNANTVAFKKKKQLILVNIYKNAILIHGNTWDVRMLIKNYQFKWNPERKGWVRKLPFQELQELVNDIREVFPDTQFTKTTVKEKIEI